MNKDFYVDFYKEIDNRIDEYLLSIKTILCGLELEEVIRTFLFSRLNLERDKYNQLRLEGKSTKESMKRVNCFF